MKNTQLYPFERNKYFYGKLLSVEDFNYEQKYINDKRRMINRLVHGIGVVCGLNVVRVDDTTISVESGLAFDPTGREIVVDMPVTKNLSTLSGYDAAFSNRSNAYVYLCLEYNEGDAGNTLNISSEDDSKKAGRVKEGYNLYLTMSEPEDTINRTESLFEQSTTVFWNGNLRIRHVIPRFVNPDESFMFRVEIETYSKQLAAFSYDIQLVCLNAKQDGSAVIRVHFDEALHEKTGRYTLNYELVSANVTNTEGTATADSESFRLSFDKNSATGALTGRSVTRIVDMNLLEAVVRDYYNQSMDTEMRSTVGQRLYLARIGLVNSLGTPIIDTIQNVPFGQYVASSVLLSAIGKYSLSEDIAAMMRKPQPMQSETEQIGDRSMQFASGICRINFNTGGLKNRTFFSDPIIHGLGLGSVTIILAAVTDSGTIYGDPAVFQDAEIPYEFAARLDPAKGSFVIGVASKSTVLQDYIDIKWTALRDVDDKVAERKNMKITIKPNSLVIKPRESKYLEAVCSNMTNKTVRWSVSPTTGGEIDANGKYIAPNTEGVYEVIAQSAVYPEIKASIMVVVRG